MAKTSKKYNAYSALFAFVVWGGWAYYINSANGFFTGLISGLAQGTFSCIMTLLIVVIVTKLFNAIHHPLLKIIVPPIVTVALTAIPLVTMHIIISTPYIIKTITLALLVSFIFCVMTVLNLRKATMGK